MEEPGTSSSESTSTKYKRSLPRSTPQQRIPRSADFEGDGAARGCGTDASSPSRPCTPPQCTEANPREHRGSRPAANAPSTSSRQATRTHRQGVRSHWSLPHARSSVARLAEKGWTTSFGLCCSDVLREALGGELGGKVEGNHTTEPHRALGTSFQRNVRLLHPLHQTLLAVVLASNCTKRRSLRTGS